MGQPKNSVTHKKGSRTVAIPLEDYRKMLADLEELESIRAFDAAKSSRERPVPFRSVARAIQHSNR
ncbi:MAG: hypothetical protein ACYDD2_05020 [Candidatus Acidiferrales bacterium]